MDDRRRKIIISVNWSSKLCKGGVTFLLWHVSGGKRNGLFLRKSAYSMLDNNGAPTVTNFSSSYVTIGGKSSREEQLNFSVASRFTSVYSRCICNGWQRNSSKQTWEIKEYRYQDRHRTWNVDATPTVNCKRWFERYSREPIEFGEITPPELWLKRWRHKHAVTHHTS